MLPRPVTRDPAPLPTQATLALPRSSRRMSSQSPRRLQSPATIATPTAVRMSRSSLRLQLLLRKLPLPLPRRQLQRRKAAVTQIAAMKTFPSLRRPLPQLLLRRLLLPRRPRALTQTAVRTRSQRRLSLPSRLPLLSSPLRRL